MFMCLFKWVGRIIRIIRRRSGQSKKGRGWVFFGLRRRCLVIGGCDFGVLLERIILFLELERALHDVEHLLHAFGLVFGLIGGDIHKVDEFTEFGRAILWGSFCAHLLVFDDIIEQLDKSRRFIAVLVLVRVDVKDIYARDALHDYAQILFLEDLVVVLRVEPLFELVERLLKLRVFFHLLCGCFEFDVYTPHLFGQVGERELLFLFFLFFVCLCDWRWCWLRYGGDGRRHRRHRGHGSGINGRRHTEGLRWFRNGRTGDCRSSTTATAAHIVVPLELG